MRLVVAMDRLIISLADAQATESITFVNILNSLVMFCPKLGQAVLKSCEFVRF